MGVVSVLTSKTGRLSSICLLMLLWGVGSNVWGQELSSPHLVDVALARALGDQLLALQASASLPGVTTNDHGKLSVFRIPEKARSLSFVPSYLREEALELHADFMANIKLPDKTILYMLDVSDTDTTIEKLIAYEVKGTNQWTRLGLISKGNDAVESRTQ